MPAPRRSLLSLFALLATLVSATPVLAAPGDAAKMLPPSTVAYAELTGIDDVAGIVLNHPLRKQIESLDEVKQAYASQGYQDYLAGLAMVETQLGKEWRPALAELTKGGVYAGFDARTQGLAILVESESEEALEKAVSTFVVLARSDNPERVKSVKYRDVSAHRIDENRFARLGKWLLITNKSELGKQIIDSHLDGADESLKDNKRFKAAYSARPKSAKLWGFVDVETIRNSGAAAEFFKGKAENPGVELLIGGLLSTAQKTPYVTFSLDVESNRLAAAVETPHESKWTPEEREFFFGPEGQGRAPLPIQLENTLFTLTTYRDFSQMWLRAGDLFDENTNDDLAQAESNLSTLFSGKDFAEDILGAVHPEVQLLVTRQDFQDILPRPSIRLPAFAVVGRLREPEKMERELRRIFQSLVGFLNVVGAMNGQPQLDLDMQRNGDALIVSSSYAPEEDERESKKARINFNFSPTVAFRKDVFVVSSTTKLAEQIVQNADAKPDDSEHNTMARANVEEVRRTLAANREHLIANNMLEEGNTREEAENEIDLLLTLMKVIDTAELQLSPGDGAMRLSLEVELKKDIQP